MEKTKVCKKCKVEKSLSAFYFRKDSNSYRNECMDCFLLHNKNYRDKYPWLVIFRNINRRCYNPEDTHYKYYGERNIKCFITEEEIKLLYIRDKAFLMKKPSIDRKDNDGDYTFENCRFIEFGENSAKDKRKPILQFDLDGKFIREWESAYQASKMLDFQQSEINRALNKKRYVQTVRGFIWKYK